MPVKLIAAKCPNCGASIPADNRYSSNYCIYCGTKILLQNDNEHIYRYIDEAEVINAEANEKIEMKRLDILNQARAVEEEAYKKNRFIGVLLIIAGAIAWFVFHGLSKEAGSASKLYSYLSPAGFIIMVMGAVIMDPHQKTTDQIAEQNKNPNSVGMPKIGVLEYTSMKYVVAKTLFESAGYTNVTCVPLNDLTKEYDNKRNNCIDSIYVNEISYFSSDKNVPKDSKITIFYHSY